MFKFLIIFMLIALPAQAKWNKYDTLRELTYITVDAVDCLQTNYIFHNGKYKEINPLIHKNHIYQYFIAGELAHFGISYVLPSKYRKIWQYSTILFEVGIVAHNVNIGIGLRF